MYSPSGAIAPLFWLDTPPFHATPPLNSYPKVTLAPLYGNKFGIYSGLKLEPVASAKVCPKATGPEEQSSSYISKIPSLSSSASQISETLSPSLSSFPEIVASHGLHAGESNGLVTAVFVPIL